jgi:hypothetical protein
VFVLSFTPVRAESAVVSTISDASHSKAFLMRVMSDAADQHPFDQFNLQAQVYVFQ